MASRTGRTILAGFLVLALTGCARPGPDKGKPAQRLTLASPAFRPGEALPADHTADGANRSPALKWSGAPARTRSFALICEDEDAPAGTFVHWVVYDIPDSARSLPEGVPATGQLPEGPAQGRNDFGRIGWSGPDPPAGRVHRYYFRLFALDTVLDARPGLSAGELRALLKGHELARAELVGRFERPVSGPAPRRG